MKTFTPLKVTVVALLMVLAAAIHTMAQSMLPAPATIHSRTDIRLDTTVPVQEYYQANIQPLGLQSQQEATRFFGKISDNLITFRPDYNSSAVLIRLHLSRVPATWTVTEWNSYINKKLNH